METITKTQRFLTLLTENRTTEAKRILGLVEYELSMLPSTLVPSQQSVVKELNAIIARLQEGYDGSAIAKASSALANFAQYRIHSLIKSFLDKDITRYYDPLSGQGDSYADIPSKTRSRHRVAGWQNILSDFSQKGKTRKETKDLWTFPGIQESGEEIQMTKEMKMSLGGQKADDFNTPVLVAERFTDLYNNEWVEAFEVLTKKNINARVAARLLLLIVEEAYIFCQQEAERQLRDIHSAFLDILEFGANMGNNRERPAELSLVAKYRRDMAESALQKLIKEFYLQKFKEISVSILGAVPDKKGVGTNYSNKAVALTWWMCVQDPPVYMVPTTTEAFDPNVYSAYDKVSSQPEYFVWPALRYSQTGDVLLKGVVKYR